ncbi:MAG: hypothetical protein ABI164_11835, partial [Acidobacteriaceae bacterium]
RITTTRRTVIVHRVCDEYWNPGLLPRPGFFPLCQPQEDSSGADQPARRIRYIPQNGIAGICISLYK